MSTPGDDEETAPPPPDPPPSSTGGHVDEPAFGDGGSGELYTPRYDIPPPPGESVGPASDPRAAAQPPPPHAPPAVVPPAASSESRRGLIAPIAAAIVLIGGVGLLVASSGSDDTETTTGPRIAEVSDPDEPRVDTTVPGDSIVDQTDPDDSVVEPSLPVQTSPPLFEPTTTVEESTDTSPAETTTTTTIATDAGVPTQDQLDAALLRVDDLGTGEWTQDEENVELTGICGTDPDEPEPVARADALFQELDVERIGVRQIYNSLMTFADEATAERAFTGGVDQLVACDSTTIDLEGVSYRVQVESSPFNDGEISDALCGDQNSFLLIQLVNEDAPIPYIGQSAFGFRCGRNVTITTLTSTIDLEDLDNADFLLGVVASNSNASELPGS